MVHFVRHSLFVDVLEEGALLVLQVVLLHGALGRRHVLHIDVLLPVGARVTVQPRFAYNQLLPTPDGAVVTGAVTGQLEFLLSTHFSNLTICIGKEKRKLRRERWQST